MVVLVKPLLLLLAIQCTPAPAQGIIPDKYVKIILHYCAETIPVYIATGMIWEESKWNEKAVSYKNGKRVAGGLFQLSFRHHAEFRDKYNGGKEFSEFDPEANTRIALRYVASLVKRFGKFRPALTYYNCGYSTPLYGRLEKLCLGRWRGLRPVSVLVPSLE